LILLAPGLLLVKFGDDYNTTAETAAWAEHAGYIWLFAASGLFMLRLLLDTSMVRRPLLEPNMSVGGLTFLGLSLALYLIVNILSGRPSEIDLSGSWRAADLTELEASPAEQRTLRTHGPGFALLYLLPHISTQSILNNVTDVPPPDEAAASQPAIHEVHVVTARIVAILSQLMIVLGIVLIGLEHFDNVKTGIAAATLYLLLPYTGLWAGAVIHALPGALLVWAVVAYRRPLIAGSMIGLAFGTIYYPIFLLPLWISFYWRRGLWRFLTGVVVMLAVLVLTLALTSVDFAMFLSRLQQMFGLRMPTSDEMSGAWQYWNGAYRYPIMVAFVFLSLSFVIWPAQKNLGTLMSASAAIMLGTHFWHAHSGGLALAWYLPLLLLTVFRPNLEDRVALTVLAGSWPVWYRRRGLVARAT
jgi:hypothetical protein